MTEVADTAPTVSQEEQALLNQLKSLRRAKQPREVLEALDAGWVPQGVRLVDPANPEEGRVLSLSHTEAEALAPPLRALASAQVAAAQAVAD